MRRHSFIILFALTALSFSDKSSSEAFSAGRSLIDVAPQQSPRIKSIYNHDLCINKELKSISELQMSSITGGAQDEPVPLSTKIKKFTQKNTFLFGMAAAVMFAKAFPSVSTVKKCKKAICQVSETLVSNAQTMNCINPTAWSQWWNHET